MNKDELSNLAEIYTRKADKAYMAYQETGISRYNNERRKNEQLADALAMAANASDDHMMLVNLRVALTDIAVRADSILQGTERLDQKVKSLLEDIVWEARLRSLIRKE